MNSLQFSRGRYQTDFITDRFILWNNIMCFMSVLSQCAVASSVFLQLRILNVLLNVQKHTADFTILYKYWERIGLDLLYSRFHSQLFCL